MSDISNIRDVYNWSIAKIAEAFALDRKAVKRKLLDANIPVANTIRGNPVYNLREVAPRFLVRQPLLILTSFTIPQKWVSVQREPC